MCIIGEAGGFRDHFGEKKKKEKKPGSNVTTSQRRDVETSRRHNVATSQLRDVTTLRRRNIATSQRRNVAMLRHRGFCLRLIKSRGDLISRSSKNVRRRARKMKQ